jgi:hypothetical protein
MCGAADVQACAMKSFASPSFFRVFDLVAARSNPGLKHAHWVDGRIEFTRERHSFTGPKHGLAIEIFTVTDPRRRGWSLMVVKEYWWAGDDSTALKNLRWARPVRGRRADILAWLRGEESRTGVTFFAGRKTEEDEAAADEQIETEEL